MKIKLLNSITLISLIVSISIISVSAQTKRDQSSPGPFKNTDESFRQYQYPEWFRDAKFGIWSHWGPQAAPRQGDWYAKDLYQEGGAYYKYHVAHYGHPSKFGYKDIIPLWKAERWNPEQLMALYKKAGAKYFVSMGVHHDNFFLWDSKIHEWNSVKMGPKKDVVGLWQKAAQKEGLRFGISEHLGASYTWFQTSRGSDKAGPMAGVPYDGNNNEYADLYHPKTTPDDKEWLTNDPENQKNWLASITEMIDMYKPDLLYSDSELPFGEIGRTMLAHYYNQDIIKNGGNLEAVYTCKELPSQGRWVQDIERGVMDSISPFPWQTDTSIGDWFYQTGQKYKTGTEVIQILVDIVSKNGNLLLNVVQTPEGDLEPDVLTILDEISNWIPVNGEGIYGTRPWKIYGENPGNVVSLKERIRFDENYKYNAQNIRFTSKGETLYVFCLDTPQRDIKITSLGSKTKLNDKTVASVKMLGSNEKLVWKQTEDALVISKPVNLPDWRVVTFKVEF